MDEPVLEMTDKTRLISIAVLISLEIILEKKKKKRLNVNEIKCAVSTGSENAATFL